MPANRIAVYLDEPRAPLCRSPAQARAARVNGRRSCGPVTAEGKARSCRNALRHGLLARVVAPPDNPLGYSQTYRQLRDQLVAQFKPATATAQAEIDGLACDLVRAARCRQLIEVSLEGPDASLEDVEPWRKCRAMRRDLAVAARLQRTLGRGDRPDCTPSEAARLAERLAELVTTIANDVAEDDAEAADGASETAAPLADTPAPRSPQVPEGVSASARARGGDTTRQVAAAEEAEFSGLRRILGVLGPRLHEYRDSGWLLPRLAGARPLSAADRRRLLAILAYWRPQARAWLAGQAHWEQKMKRLRLANLAAIAAAPDRAMLLEVYLGRIERLIDLKLQRLRAR